MAALTTIKENNTFRRLYRSKMCYVYPQIVVYVSKNRLGKFRYGITTSKKVGGAVQRSRCRRIIRAAVSEYEESVRDKGYDVVFVARKRTVQLKSTDLAEPIGKSLKKAGLLD